MVVTMSFFKSFILVSSLAVLGSPLSAGEDKDKPKIAIKKSIKKRQAKNRISLTRHRKVGQCIENIDPIVSSDDEKTHERQASPNMHRGNPQSLFIIDDIVEFEFPSKPPIHHQQEVEDISDSDENESPLRRNLPRSLATRLSNDQDFDVVYCSEEEGSANNMKGGTGLYIQDEEIPSLITPPLYQLSNMSNEPDDIDVSSDDEGETSSLSNPPGSTQSKPQSLQSLWELVPEKEIKPFSFALEKRFERNAGKNTIHDFRDSYKLAEKLPVTSGGRKVHEMFKMQANQDPGSVPDKDRSKTYTHYKKEK